MANAKKYKNVGYNGLAIALLEARAITYYMCCHLADVIVVAAFE
ncbi:hypothetical protein [Mastigocoleus testarum]|nr:hypothetical protein [Mastigocoleus testarum]